MIITKLVEIIGNPSNLKRLRDFGYKIKIGESIKVDVSSLSSGSHVKINCKCDNFGLIKSLKYQYYNLNTKYQKEKYYCFKCRISKPNTIKYEIDNKYKIYHPDYFYEELNLIIEIKSSYTYEKDLEKNLLKQKSCLEKGYNFIFIINKDYNKFSEFILHLESH